MSVEVKRVVDIMSHYTKQVAAEVKSLRQYQQLCAKEGWVVNRTRSYANPGTAGRGQVRHQIKSPPLPFRRVEQE